MPRPDFTPFHGADLSRLTGDQLHATRATFATAVCDLAANCKDNQELLDVLIAALPTGAELKKLGQGSTRTVWSLPFGLIMKLNREDQPDTAPNYSHWLLAALSWTDHRQALSRRRHSTWRELTLAIRYPNLFPRIFGVLFAFGEVPQNPSVLIMERVTPLSEVFGDNDADLRIEDMCIQPQTGRLQVYDKRITDEAHTHCQGCFAETIKPVEDVTDIRNVGLDDKGRLVLLDGGNYFTEGFSLASGWVPDRIWWLETSPDNPAHMRQTVEVSRMIFDGYSDCRAIWQKENTCDYRQ